MMAGAVGASVLQTIASGMILKAQIVSGDVGAIADSHSNHFSMAPTAPAIILAFKMIPGAIVCKKLAPTAPAIISAWRRQLQQLF